MKINDVVFQEYQGIRRFGVTTEKKMRGGWAFWKVKWFSDEPYERAMTTLRDLRKKDLTRYEYRNDELKVVDTKRELTALCECISFAEGKQRSTVEDERQQANIFQV
tara:strand:- start:1289 stop:1609 length:321 start_codon:yes stop_codon:yes gene_type:complete